MPIPSTTQCQSASVFRRSSAAFIDGSGLVLITTCLLWVTYGRQYFNLEYLPLLPGYRSFLICAALVPGAALFTCWLLWDNTPGKALFKLSIVDHANASRPSKAQFAKRLAGYYLSVASLGLGFLFALTQTNRQGLHDKLAGTLVVDPTSRPSRSASSEGSSQWLPFILAFTNLTISVLVYYSPIGAGDGNGVIGYSIYRGLLLIFLHLPLAVTGLVTAIAIGLATQARRAGPGIAVNVAAAMGVLLIQHYASQ